MDPLPPEVAPDATLTAPVADTKLTPWQQIASLPNSVVTPTAEDSPPPPNLCCAQAVLVCRKNSHPFVERKVTLEAAAKVGRAVARCKPSDDNFVFDCKVLSRNHAILWFENHKFYLKDTASSNGTFVNNQRLSPANEESAPREVFSGDVVQFGVDVTENTRKVTHGCIIATLRLYLADGSEAKAQEQQQHPQSPSQTSVAITSQQLYELSQYLNEALHREQILENKLETLERVVTSAHESANTGWKSLVEEDRLLSRIETLQSKLEVLVTSQQNSKDSKDKDNVDSTAADSSPLNTIRAEALKLIEDKEKYESAAKEAIQKALEEKLIVLNRLHELEVAIKSHEEECSRLQLVCETSAQEINRLANNNDELNKEIESYVKRLKNFEDQKIALIEATNKEREELEEKMASLRAKEMDNNRLMNELKSLNEAANLQIEKLRLQLEVIKQSEKVVNDTNDSNDIKDTNNGNNDIDINSGADEGTDSAYITNDFVGDDVRKMKKQLAVNNDNSVDLELNGVAQKGLTDSSVTVTESMTGSLNSSQQYMNGQLSTSATDQPTSASPTSDSVAPVSQLPDTKEESPVPSDQTASHLSAEVETLRELLAETRSAKKSIEEELSRTVTELENLRSLTKQMSLEAEEAQQKLDKSHKEVEEKSVLITTLKNQINELTERVRNAVKDNESIRCKILENEKLLHLKDDELSSLKVLLEEERRVQQKYANNYDQCKRQLCEQQVQLKQSQTEAELLRKKVYSCNEELRTSRSNLSVGPAADESLVAKQKELDRLQTDYHSLRSQLDQSEGQLISYRTSQEKLTKEFQCLQSSMQLLQKINSELEQRGDSYWRDQYNTSAANAQTHQTQLINISKELEELKLKFDDCSQENKSVNERLMSAEEDIEIFSYQSKIATACAMVPLFILLVAVLMAYYPSVSTVTGTTEM